MKNKLFESILTAIMTPILYVIYAISVILLTFVFGLPIAIGVYIIDITMKIIFNWS
jgi:hypothetical protein